MSILITIDISPPTNNFETKVILHSDEELFLIAFHQNNREKPKEEIMGLHFTKTKLIELKAAITTLLNLELK